MTWSKPKAREVKCGMEINMYGPAETTLGIDEGWERTTIGRFTLYRPGATRAATVAAPATAKTITTTGLPSRWAAQAEGR